MSHKNLSESFVRKPQEPHSNLNQAMNPASAKRGAASPAEGEKSKKADAKSTPTSPTCFLGSFKRALGGGTQPQVESPPEQTSNTLMSDEESEEEEWQMQSSRRRRWSTGRTPGNSPPPKERHVPNKHPQPGPNPQFIHKHTAPCFEVKNEGAFRSEIEIEIQTINDQAFRGTITTHEAKHSIYREALGGLFSNFRGVRFGYKGVPIVTIMLKNPINIDDFASFQFFSFTRSYLKGGKQIKDVLACKIRGVRTVTGGEATASYSEDWTRVVKIEGCDYRVSKEMILSWLSFYGEVLSDLVEDVFEDSEDSEGTNATGIYSVKMKLTDSIPQLLPMDGRRIKVYYRGISKLCTSCFGKHVRRDCKNEKVQWIDYVYNFVNNNMEISKDHYGKWIAILEKVSRQKTTNDEHQEKGKDQPSEQEPTTDLSEEVNGITPPKTNEEINTHFVQDTITLEASVNIQSTLAIGQDDLLLPQVTMSQPTMKEFNIPESEEEMAKLITTMLGCGMTSKDVEINIEKRKKLYNAAIKDFNKPHTKKGRPTGTRKNSK